MLRKIGLFSILSIIATVAAAAYLLRGGFHRFIVAPYKVHPAAFSSWNDVLKNPRDISLVTIQTGVIHMDACLNLDPKSSQQSECNHVPRDLAVLVHWVHHPRFGDFLIDAGFDDSFAKHPLTAITQRRWRCSIGSTE